ncbi:MAG: serine hydrolase [Saprospiraceae bacterium]|nr:serine hydrolase [Saprospiraceae bacterium]
MKYRFSLIVIFLASFFSETRAQTGGPGILNWFQESGNAIVALKNEKNLIPLQRLDTLKVASLVIRLPKGNYFQNTLDQYVPTAQMGIGVKEDTDYQALAKEIAQQYNVVIAAVDADAIRDDIVGPFKMMDRLFSTLRKETNFILVILGQGEVWANLAVHNYSDVLIYAPFNDNFTQSLSAQAIFGAAGLSSKLPSDLSYTYREGDGLTIPGGLRLRFSPPEAIGINGDSLRNGINTILMEGLNAKAFPGVQALVAKDGHIIYHQVFGRQTYDPNSPPVAHQDLYDLASITKISASLPALMRLYEEGKIDLDAPLKSWYPKFKQSNKKKLTLRRLLTHTARIKAWIPFWRNTLKKNGTFKKNTFQRDSSGVFNVKVTDSLWLHQEYRDKIFKAIKKSKLNKEPGYVYSDMSFYLYPEVVESLTGQPFETYLKNTFYRRLGANSLTFNPLRFYPKDWIIPTENDTFFRKTQIHGVVHDEGAIMLGGVSGHAGLFGNITDLAKLMQLYLNGGTYGGERYLSEATLKTFNSRPYESEGIHRGIGFDKPLLKYDPEKSHTAAAVSPESFGHSGFTGTFTWVDPKENLIFIFFSNRVYPTRDNRKLIEMRIRQRVQEAIYRVIGK